MLPQERQKLIEDYVNKNNIVMIDKLCSLTNASIATVHRDINFLASKKRLKKIHGGVQKIQTESKNPLFNYSEIAARDEFFETKNRNAQIAASLVKPGEKIFLGAGLTSTLMSRYIKDIHDISVVTTNINSVIELSDSTSVMLIGGDIYRGASHIETISELSAGLLNKLYFDKAFFTVDGADIEYGYSIVKKFQLPLYSYLLNNSTETFLFLDDGKINKRAFLSVCGLNRINNIIYAGDLPKAFEDYYKNENIKIYNS